jgi:tetratricopeptide (TPR) repeat protein
MSDTKLTAAELALEQNGLEFLRVGKFRKARDAFKSLNKSQPSRALPLLIDANLGLAHEMMTKGQVSEANQVLAYLKTIAPAGFNPNLTPPVVAANPRDAWATKVPLAAQRLASSAPLTDSAICAADEMILGASSPDHPAHPDAHTILTALELGYGAAAAAVTAALLRSVPRSSPFSHWVLFFKGMTALEAGDRDRAAECFRRVPEKSLLHSAISALLTLCGVSETPQPTHRTVRALCSWAGLTQLAEPLLLADPLWRKKQHSKAFTLLTKKVPGLFSLGARSFNSDLTRLLTAEFVACDQDTSDYFGTVLDYVGPKSRSLASAAVDQSFFTIEFASFSSCAHGHFATVIENLDAISRVAPISLAMRSRIFTQTAEAYISSVKNDPGDRCSGPNAKKALGRAISDDPNNLRAWLMQCDLLAMGKDTSTYHRFLDDLTKRFPTHKEVLIRNGDCCTERKSYTKALRNFENAAKVDSVDPRITRGILRAHLGAAEDAYNKRTPTKANWDLINSLASTDKSDAEYSAWRLRVRRIVLEIGCGIDEVEVGAHVAAALPLAPNAFLLETACRFAILKRGLVLKEKSLAILFPSRPIPESLADFLAVIDEVATFEEGNFHTGAENAAQEIFTAHRALLLRFVVVRKDLTTLLIRICSSTRPDLFLACPVIEQWFRRDPSDPLLGLICGNYHFPWLKGVPNFPMMELASQLLNSPDPDDRRLLSLLQRDALRDPVPTYGKNRRGKAAKLDLDYDPHDEDGDYDEEEDDEDFSDLEQALGKMSQPELIKILNQALGSAGFPLPGSGRKNSPSKPFRV